MESGQVAASSLGTQFDILPIANGESLCLTADQVLTGTFAHAGSGFLGSLDAWCASLVTGQTADSEVVTPKLPFRGGWLVYLSYEISREIEPGLNLPPGPDRIIAKAIRAPAAWVRNRRSNCAWLIAEVGYDHLIEQFERHVSSAVPLALRAPLRFEVYEEDPRKFCDRVDRSLEYIAAGDIYQANLSREWRVHSQRKIDPVAVYQRLRRANPAPFSALLQLGTLSIMSSSPERLAMISQRRISTRPIAGTRPRGRTPEEDAALISALLNSEKDRAEHIMLIDLERNDLGRVCTAGSVHVDEFMCVESYAHVHHIVSNVSGELRPGVAAIPALKAVFPGGTITGCPKYRCMQIIAELEGVGRGAYTGSLGYINRDGDADFNILIRSMSLVETDLRFRAGAGIVADSNAELELAETRAKAEGLLRALR